MENLTVKDLILAPNLTSDEVNIILSKYNFTDLTKADRNLQRLAGEPPTRQLFADIAETLLIAISQSPDPDAALNNLERFANATFDRRILYTFLRDIPALIAVLVTICGFSQYLSDTLIRNPEYFEWLMEPDVINHPKERDAMYQELSQMVNGLGQSHCPYHLDKKLDAMRRYKRRETLRIGLRDLLGDADLEMTTLELSNLADVSLQIAYELAEAELTPKLGEPQASEGGRRKVEGGMGMARGQTTPLPPFGRGMGKGGFAVIGMGKLGGHELNFSSDIDVMFVYSSEGKTTPPLTPPSTGGNGGAPLLRGTSEGVDNREYFTKMSEFIINALSKMTEEGYVFRVDIRLRPESSAGSIVRSLDSYEAYYESWGEIWERQALIKARPVAGDEKLGQDFIEMIEPFVYQRYLDLETIELIKEDIRQTKARIEQRIGAKALKSHVKLGMGSIRDIEFIVQYLQLINGGKDKELRDRNTLKTIDLLCSKGYFDETESARLKSAYRFLRTVEHRLQILADRQLHILPTKPDELNKLAKRMGYPVAQTFLSAHETHTSYVQEIFQRIFQPPSEEGVLGIEALIESDDESAIAAILKPYNFRDANAAQKRLKLLADGPIPPFPKGGRGISPLIPLNKGGRGLWGVRELSKRKVWSERTRHLFLDIAPTLLNYVGESPDPDMALDYFERFISVAGARASYYKLFFENPQIIELLVKLCGTSKFLTEILIQNPELLDILTNPELMSHQKSQQTMRAELENTLKRYRVNPFESIRKYKNGEWLRIGIRDILGSVIASLIASCLATQPSALSETTEDLSNLAEVILQQAYEIVDSDLRKEWGIPKSEDGEEVAFAIIGMGKLAGRELNYNSDLDLIFAYSADGTTTTGKSNYDYFTKLGQELVTRMTNARGGGPVYELDLRLRPFGKAGSIALSLKGYQDYYDKHAEVWERQALIKSRPVAGDLNFGEQFIQIAHAFAYSQPLTSEQIAEIIHTRERKEDKAKSPLPPFSKGGRGGISRTRDVKIGYGGLADIEFAVQTLQLVHGWQNPDVRSPNTLLALEQLRDAGAISTEQCQQLSKLYQFLRMVENRLRIVHDRPFNALPTEPHELEKLAKRLGYADDNLPAAQQFMQDYQDCTSQTRQLFNELLV
jgi:glutamate-ammonia-ligase adenylyltransferase